MNSVSDGDVRGFLHVCCMGSYREVLWEIVHALLESRLYDRSASIEVAVLGSDADQRVVEDLLEPFDRFRIAYRSPDLAEYEFPTLALLQGACRDWDGPVYYLHTKGVSMSPRNQFSRYWRRLMLDIVVTNHERCLAELRAFDTAGPNWSEDGIYSGNFWWARASHIRTLPDIWELQRTPRSIVRAADLDGAAQRGAGPVWNQRLQCEFWLHINPGLPAKIGPSRPNLYRQLLWTTSITDVVNELLDVSAAQRLAEVHSDADVPASPDGDYDLILIDVRDDPQHVLDLIERCVPKLAADGALVVHYSNPPSAWHQRPVHGPPATEWTGQVWRAVVEFRRRHRQCEVFTVDTHWGCAVIRPNRPARGEVEVESVNRLGWRDLAEHRDQLLNLVDVAWFRRNLYAARYLAGAAAPSSAVELVNILISAEGLDSCLAIGATADTVDRIIAPIRHSVRSVDDAEGLTLGHYDVVLIDGPDSGQGFEREFERVLSRVSDGGWIVAGRTLPESWAPAEVDWWTADLDRSYTLIRRRPERSVPHHVEAVLSLFRRGGVAPTNRSIDRPPTDWAESSRLIAQPYDSDVDTLLSAVELDPDDLRSVLLLADAYYDADDSEAARRWYARAGELRDWWWTNFDIGIYIATLRLAQLMERAGEPWADVRDTYLRAWEIRPDRTAPLHAIAYHYRVTGHYRLGYLHAKAALDMPCPDPDKPLPNEVAVWRAKDEFALCAALQGKRTEAFPVWRELLSRTDLPEDQRRRIAGNLDECVPAMLAAASVYPADTVRSLRGTARDSGITVTVIAGPGRATVEKTLNSFLNCCRDVGRVGRFLAIDTGLAAEDRSALQERYGFLEFVTAPEQLALIRPHVEARLWLHVGRGWRFYVPDDLISRLEDKLAAEPDAVRVAVSASPSAECPAMYDTARLDRAEGLAADPAGLSTATLGETLAARQTVVTVIGRGNSGTRAISNTLMRSGVFMGKPIKEDSADLVPAEDMYEACRIISRYIPWLGGLEWDFRPVQTMPIPAEFTRLVERYLSSVLDSSAPHVGWKLPETTLCYPWITRMFPDIRYIFWVRNPRDCITNFHFTDDLSDFGIDYPKTDNVFLRRAISWKYQDDLVAATPPPKHRIKIRLEDFITHQDRELARLQTFLGFPMARIPVRTDPIDRHKRMPDVPFPEFLAGPMNRHGYDI